MTAAGAWSEKAKKGQDLLASLGSTEVQRKVLGVDYCWVQKVLTDGVLPPAAPASISSNGVGKRPAEQAAAPPGLAKRSKVL